MGLIPGKVAELLPMKRAGWGIVAFRAAAGAAALLVSLSSAIPTINRGGRHVRDPALSWTVRLLGLFILGHVLVELLAIALSHWHDSTSTQQASQAQATMPVDAVLNRALSEGWGPSQNANPPHPFSAMSNILTTTPGVVLGLLAVFGSTDILTDTLKVASVSLAAALLLAIVLSGFVAMVGATEQPLSTLVRMLFNVTLWALALGLLGIAMGLVYRH
jgi:ABC-type phosphate/phosphonate transport system permease subunit